MFDSPVMDENCRATNLPPPFPGPQQVLHRHYRAARSHLRRFAPDFHYKWSYCCGFARRCQRTSQRRSDTVVGHGGVANDGNPKPVSYFPEAEVSYTQEDESSNLLPGPEWSAAWSVKILPFSCEPTAQPARRCYTNVPAAGSSAATALWVFRSEVDALGFSGTIEAGHAPAEYEYATAST